MSVPVPTWRLAAVAAVLAPILPGAARQRLDPARRGRRRPARRSRSSTQRSLAHAAGASRSSATVPGVRRRSASRATVTWAVAQPDGRTLRVSIADELAPSLHAEVAARGYASRHGAGRPSAPRSARRGAAGSRSASSWCASTVRSGWPRGSGRAPCRRCCACYPPFRSPRRSRAAHQPRPHPRGRPALGAGPRRRHRVRSAARVRARRRVPAHRLVGDRRAPARPIVRTYRAERNQTVLLLLDNGRVMAGRVDGRAPRSSTRWTR